MVRDIRELTDSPEAYAAELRRRWGGLLSYRYSDAATYRWIWARGPFRVETEPMIGPDGAVAVRAVMHDEGPAIA